MAPAPLLSPAPTGLRHRAAVGLAIVSIGLLGGWMTAAGAEVEAEVDATAELNPNPATVGSVVAVTMANTSLVCNTDLGEVDSYIRLIAALPDRNDVEGVVQSGTVGGTLTLPSDLPPGTYSVEFQCTQSVGNSILRIGSLVVQAVPETTTTTTSTTSTTVVTTTTAAPTTTAAVVSPPAPTTTIRVAVRGATQSSGSSYSSNPPVGTVFADCTDAYSRGYAKILRGSPGYASKLDSDNDGVACQNPPGSTKLSASGTVNSGSELAVTGTSQSLPLAAAGAALLMLGIAGVRTNRGKKWYTSANGTVRYTIDSVTKRR